MFYKTSGFCVSCSVVKRSMISTKAQHSTGFLIFLEGLFFSPPAKATTKSAVLLCWGTQKLLPPPTGGR